ncbi:hypothetical protein PpBr36_08004 [Pyricularia pennisetigena]|uniref:hypothetical protein n=1 Tax=Pyricularia pennisetigena TaxID=1578925 RepID=UPI001153169C|nr:hypothetical protein PpBr36_08004 [Pyricularia pennisetigena]TLS24734.1 hypothetical protein PpBr36_08004 [Pyricularia pennisetigena]
MAHVPPHPRYLVVESPKSHTLDRDRIFLVAPQQRLLRAHIANGSGRAACAANS